MDSYDQLEMLLELAGQVGIQVRRVPGGDNDHPGGAVVRVRERTLIFLDPLAALADQVAVAASALRGRAELEAMYLPPEIRRILGGDADAEQ